MAKLILFAALIAAIILSAAARTTITTVEVDDDNSFNKGQSQQCQQVGAEKISRCNEFIMQGCAQQTGMIIRTVSSEECQKQRQQCCNQLEDVNEQCRCYAIKQMVKQQMGQGQQGQMGRQELRKMAQNLPAMCQIPPWTCQM